jgi:hypothetical protein
MISAQLRGLYETMGPSSSPDSPESQPDVDFDEDDVGDTDVSILPAGLDSALLECRTHRVPSRGCRLLLQSG